MYVTIYNKCAFLQSITTIDQWSQICSSSTDHMKESVQSYHARTYSLYVYILPRCCAGYAHHEHRNYRHPDPDARDVARWDDVPVDAGDLIATRVAHDVLGAML